MAQTLQQQRSPSRARRNKKPPRVPVIPAIDIRHLCKRFGNADRNAVDNLSLTIAQGEIFGLLGPNGSGKTTTINMISTLSLPTSGTVRVFGYDVQQDAMQVRRFLGCVPQETALFEELSPRQLLDYHAALYGVPRRERAERIQSMLELVHLWGQKDALIKTFSGGMKRRLALARALLHRPRVLYLDEPTLGVDVQNRRILYEFIRQLPAQGITVLVTTNDMREAELLCTRIAILDHGVLQIVDTPQHLTKQSIAKTTHLLLTLDSAHQGGRLLHALRQVAGIQKVELQGVALSLVTNNGQNELATMLRLINEHGRTVRFISTETGDLEQAYLQITGEIVRE